MGNESRTKEPDEFRLLARFICRASDPAVANQLQCRLLEALADFTAAAASDPEAYWKIPDSFEIDLMLSPPSEVTFERFLSLAPEGWTIVRDGECSAVWNHLPNVALLIPEVFWAEILFYRPNPPESGAQIEH